LDSNWIALGSLAFFIMLQTIIASFMLGGLFQRVKQLEARPIDGDCKTELAVLNSRFTGLAVDVAGITEDMKTLLGGQTPAARRRSEGG
jgi:hypothetical protein